MIIAFLSRFVKVIFNGIAEFVRLLIILKVSFLSLTSTFKMLLKRNANQYNDDK